MDHYTSWTSSSSATESLPPFRTTPILSYPNQTTSTPLTETGYKTRDIFTKNQAFLFQDQSYMYTSCPVSVSNQPTRHFPDPTTHGGISNTKYQNLSQFPHPDFNDVENQFSFFCGQASPTVDTASAIGMNWGGDTPTATEPKPNVYGFRYPLCHDAYSVRGLL